MKTPSSRWPQLLALVIILMIATQGLLNAARPIIGWLVGLTAGAAVIAVVILLFYRRTGRW